METPNLPAIRALRPAWNKGRIVGQKRPLKPKHVWAIRVRLELAENHRDLALFNMAIDSKLRGCDLCRMQVVDVMASGQIKERASVLQNKTQKPVRFEISEGTQASVAKWMEDPLMVGSEFLWPGRFHERLHISTRQYARIVRDWVTSIGLEATAYGTHSMRRTKVTQIYKKTGNLRAVQLLLGHTKMDSTVRYLGVELEDALAIAEAIEILIAGLPSRAARRCHLKTKRTAASHVMLTKTHGKSRRSTTVAITSGASLASHTGLTFARVKQLGLGSCLTMT